MRMKMMALVPVIVAMWTLASSPEPVVVSSASNPFVEAPQPLCGHCHFANCTGPGHEFDEAEPYDLDGLGHGCLNQDCEDFHPECGAGKDQTPTGQDNLVRETKEILVALSSAASDKRFLASLIQVNRERMTYNRERGRVQISSTCSPDVVIAQIAVSESEFLAASAAANSVRN